MNVPTWIPDPDVAAKAHLHLGVPQVLGMGGRKQLEQLPRDRPLLGKCCPDRPNKLSHLDRSFKDASRPTRMASELGTRIGAIGGRQDTGMFDPLHERVKVPQVLLARGRPAT